MFGTKQQNPELKTVEKELCSFYEYCKMNSFSKEEMEEICKPLHLLIRKSLLMRYIRYITYFVLISSFLYYICISETILWNLSAIGRVFMVKLLPFWNWEKLSNQKCLINNFLREPEPILAPKFDCTLCEAIDDIPTTTNIDPYVLSEIYLDLNIPVVITDGLKNYPHIDNANHFNLSEDILSDETLATSVPCELSTNMLPTSNYKMSDIIAKPVKFKKWFLHFQNCDFNAVKQFRILAPRPYFLRPEIIPIQYSWLLMSDNYQVSKYKKLELVDKIAVFAQMNGSNYIRLIPRLNCADECPILEMELQHNEAIVFTSLWDLEYKPNHISRNIAVVLETH